MEWRVEELKLKKEAESNLDNYLNGVLHLKSDFKFACENELSTEDKIETIDKYTNNKMTRFIEASKKFDEEKDSMPKDSWGHVKTVSLNAWIKRNGYSDFIDTNYNYGQINLLGAYLYIQYYKDIDKNIDMLFHRLLIDLMRKEEIYFKQVDEFEILKERLRNYIRRYGSLGVELAYGTMGVRIYDSNDENARQITLEEARLLVSKYEEIEKFISEKEKEIKITY